MARQRDADQKAAVSPKDIQQLTDSVENYAQTLINAEANVAQVHDGRDAEHEHAKEELQKYRAYRGRMVDLGNQLAKVSSQGSTYPAPVPLPALH